MLVNVDKNGSIGNFFKILSVLESLENTAFNKPHKEKSEFFYLVLNIAFMKGKTGLLQFFAIYNDMVLLKLYEIQCHLFVR